MKQYCALCCAWIVACLSVCLSIYLSEGLNIGNCTLCWIQRMCMYPLSVILGIAVFNSSLSVVPYVMPQVCFGCCTACYHVALQSHLLPDFLNLCQAGPTCLDSYRIGLSFVSFPMLSVCAFCCIICCLSFCYRPIGEAQLVSIKIK